MKRAIKVIRRTVWTCIAVYAAVLLLCQLPPVQRLMGNAVASYLKRQLNTDVQIGSVDVGLLNRLIINDVHIKDQNGGVLLDADRAAGKVSIPKLVKGTVQLSSLQLIAPKATLWRKDEDGKLNCQFLLDVLFPADKDKQRTTDLRIDELTVVDGRLTYDIRNRKHRPQQLDMAHISLKDLNTHIVVDTMDERRMNFRVKRFSCNERCGISVENLSGDFHFMTKEKLLNVFHLNVETAGSNIKSEWCGLAFPEGISSVFMTNTNGEIAPQEVRLLTGTTLPVKQNVRLHTAFEFLDNTLNISGLQLSTADGALAVDCSGQHSFDKHAPLTALDITRLHATAATMGDISRWLAAKRVNIPAVVSRLGGVDFNGFIRHEGKAWQGGGELQCAQGRVSGDVDYNGTTLDGRLKTDGFQVGALLADSRVQHIAGDVQVSGDASLLLGSSAATAMTMKGEIKSITLAKPALTLHNVSVDGRLAGNTYEGHLALNDGHGQLNMTGNANLSAANTKINTELQARNVDAAVLGLSGKDSKVRLDFDMDADIAGLNINTFAGDVNLHNVRISSPDGDVSIPYVGLSAANLGEGERRMTLHSPYTDARIEGKFNPGTLGGSLKHILGRRLPAITLREKNTTAYDNNCKISLEMYSAEWLSRLTGTDIHCNEPIRMEGLLQDATGDINMSLSMPSIRYKGKPYEHTSLTIHTRQDTINIEGQTRRVSDDAPPFDVQLMAEAFDDRMMSTLSFDNHGEKRHVSGQLVAQTQLFNADSQTPVTHISFLPSTLHVNEATWNVQPSDIVFQRGKLIVDHLSVRNGEQHITATGIAAADSEQKIDLTYHGVDVGLLSDLLNVNGVTFDGRVNGQAQIYGIFDTPRAYAQLNIEDFSFTGSPLGTFSGRAQWNGTLNRISIHGQCEEDNSLSRTLVDGNISLAPLDIDLDIGVNNTRTAFMETYLRGVIGKMDARATGGIHVFGTSRHVNIEGMVAVNGDISLAPLNTTYTLRGDTVDFLPGHITFRNLNLNDEREKTLHFRGDVFHDYLKQWTYNLHLDGSDIALLNRPDFDGGTACGKLYGDADVTIANGTGEVNIDAECTPRAGSIIQYNASQREHLHEREFLRWHDATARQEDGTTPQGNGGQQGNNLPPLPTDLKMNMVLNATPDLTLRVVMNDETDDYIDLKGEGRLRASYFNKGGLNIYGNYTVADGTYRMTIQNLLSRLFTFQNGGTIVFSGDPLNAAINLKAVHTLNSVSLADLQIGNSFKSNNIRVNCLLNLHGTPMQPQVDFDLDMPTAGTDAAQMVRSLINSEEELNQQVIYLLTIGRFYNPENTNASQDGTTQSQTSLAMQSLLSGTVSGQLNSLLANVLPNNNWTIGANISTGDEGWNNAEYEGLLSGRLLNNRLLINGQFGYRDNANATTSFIGDFDVRYLLFPNGNLAVRVYNQTNDRYFTRNSLNTQGIGLIIKKDFNTPRDLFRSKRKWNKLKLNADTLDAH